MTKSLVLSFPYPVPAGTRVPQWTLINVTVRNHVIYNMIRIVSTTYFSSRTTGTSRSLRPSVVGIRLSALRWPISRTHMVFSDSPEILPGTLIGQPRSSNTTATGGATAVQTSSLSRIAATSPTSSPELSQSGSSSHVGAISGAIVGGVAAIFITAGAIIFCLRRYHPTVLSGGVSQPPIMAQQLRSQEAAFPSASPFASTSVYPSTSASPPIPASSPESPVNSLRGYVRGIRAFVMAVCVFMLRSLFLDTLRTRAIRPRSLGTESLCLCQTSPAPSHLTYCPFTKLEPELVQLPCIQRRRTNIMVPPFDFDCNLLRISFFL
jgi:hypothetical protein